MRKHLKPVSAGLAGLTFLLLAGCGGGAQASPGGSGASCLNSSLPHRAYVVVEHGSGATLDRCVGFSGDSIAGDALMKASGIPYQTQHFSFGDAVCAMDKEPKSFDSCLPQGAPYWALWTESGGGAWQEAQVGLADLKLGAGDAIGWRYTPQAEASPSPPPAPRK